MKKTYILFIIIIVTTFLFFHFIIEDLNNQKAKNVKQISDQQSLIDNQQSQIFSLKKGISAFPREIFFEVEQKVKGSSVDIDLLRYEKRLNENAILYKYQLAEGFYTGINNLYPGSGFIDFYQKNLFVLSSRGILAYTNNLENLYLKQIKNNINDFIDNKQFLKKDGYKFSLKDLHIFKNRIFISYTEEIKKDCWNTSIIYGDIDYKNIKFTKLFSSKECVHSSKNQDNSFNAHNSGGGIEDFDDHNILLSIGDYDVKFLSQDEKSVNGKIIKINLQSLNYEIVSVGHRNPQGLYYDKENNFILETEHGPYGGDEVNLIDIKMSNLPNYGWPLSSYGRHYHDDPNSNKYPLKSSHREYNFIEPLRSFSPSIGISKIAKIDNEKFVISAMAEKGLYFFQLDKNKKLTNLVHLFLDERVRDIKFSKHDRKLYLFLEDSASIGILEFK